MRDRLREREQQASIVRKKSKKNQVMDRRERRSLLKVRAWIQKREKFKMLMKYCILSPFEAAKGHFGHGQCTACWVPSKDEECLFREGLPVFRADGRLAGGVGGALSARTSSSGRIEHTQARMEALDLKTPAWVVQTGLQRPSKQSPEFRQRFRSLGYGFAPPKIDLTAS